MAPLSQALSSILVSAKASDKFKAFLESNDFTEVDQIGLLAATESKLEESVFPMLKTAGVPVESLADMISLKKAWMLCRTAMERDQYTSSGRVAVPTNDVLPAPDRTAMTATWKKTYNYNLPGDRLLTETLISQLYRELNAQPKRLSIYMMESLRVQSALIHRPRSMVVSSRPGEPMTTEEIVADEVQNSMELFCRARAFFSTCALVTVHEPTYFPLQDLVYMEDKLFDLLQYVHKSGDRTRRPPLAHFIGAWAMTLRIFSDEIRTNARTLSSLVHDTSAWQSAWTSWSPPAGDVGQQHSSGSAPGRERELEREIDRLKKLAASVQSQRDRDNNARNYACRGNDDREKEWRDSRKRDRSPGKGDPKGGKKGKGGKGGKDRH